MALQEGANCDILFQSVADTRKKLDALKGK